MIGDLGAVLCIDDNERWPHQMLHALVASSISSFLFLDTWSSVITSPGKVLERQLTITGWFGKHGLSETFGHKHAFRYVYHAHPPRSRKDGNDSKFFIRFLLTALSSPWVRVG